MESLTQSSKEPGGVPPMGGLLLVSLSFDWKGVESTKITLHLFNLRISAQVGASLSDKNRREKTKQKPHYKHLHHTQLNRSLEFSLSLTAHPTQQQFRGLYLAAEGHCPSDTLQSPYASRGGLEGARLA